MTNPIQHYDWGSTTAIPRLLGREDLEGTPCAELWMGAHPKAPSTVHTAGGDLLLSDLIGEDPEGVLGRAVVRRFGAALPFLFKVLAAERALSIQSHPRMDQADAGFAREDAEGIPRDAFHRNYRDRNHKPELITALTEFWALRGFRPVEEILEEFAGLSTVRDAVDTLSRSKGPRGLARFFRHLMTLEDDVNDRLLQEAEERFGDSSEPHHRWIAELRGQHGTDIGVLAPLYLNCIRLQPGEALFLPAQTLHAYLSGVGVEVMANSDNVLRGGLTTKHLDVEELLSSLVFTAERPPVLLPEPDDDPGVERFFTAAEEFDLRRIAVTPGEESSLRGRETPRILLCVEGAVAARAASDAGEGRSLSQGHSLFATARAGGITLEGEGVVYVAGVPEAA